MDTLSIRARLALAVTGQEAADLGRGVVADVAVPLAAGERITMTRRLRLLSIALVDRAVLVELADGASWEQVADALGVPVEEARRVYEPTWVAWSADAGFLAYDAGDRGVGMPADADAAGTAAALDSWCVRHAEPWDEPVSEPVSRILTD